MILFFKSLGPSNKVALAQLLLQFLRVIQQVQLVAIFIGIGNSEYGKWLLLLSYAMFASFIDFGFQSAANVKILKLGSRRSSFQFRFWVNGCYSAYRYISQIALVVFFVGAFFALVVNFFWAELFGTFDFILPAVFLFLSFCFVPYQNFLGAVYAAKMRSHMGVGLVVLQVFVQVVLFYFLSIVLSALMAVSVSFLTGAALSAWLGRVGLSAEIDPGVGFSKIRFLLIFRLLYKKAPVYFINPFLGQFLQSAQIFIISYFFGPGLVLAGFGISRTIIGVVRQLVAQIGAGALVVYIRDYFDGNVAAFSVKYWRLIILMAMALSFFVGVVLLQGGVIYKMFPTKFNMGFQQILFVTGVFSLFSGASMCAQSFFPTIGRPHVVTFANVLLTVFILLAVCLPLGEANGIHLVSYLGALDLVGGVLVVFVSLKLVSQETAVKRLFLLILMVCLTGILGIGCGWISQFLILKFLG